MKTKIEINQKIKELQRQLKLRYSQKREAKDESVRMSMIDNEIERLASQIRSLQWVLS